MLEGTVATVDLSLHSVAGSKGVVFDGDIEVQPLPFPIVPLNS